MGISLEEKWDKVRAHYESAYKIKFKQMPSEDKVEFLYTEMNRLSKTVDQYFERAKTDLEAFVNHRFTSKTRQKYEQ